MTLTSKWLETCGVETGRDARPAEAGDANLWRHLSPATTAERKTLAATKTMRMNAPAGVG